MPFLRFARNTALLSLASLVPLLILFVATTPGFGSVLLDGGPALGLFLRQVLLNGLTLVFVVNYVALFLYALLEARPPEAWDSGVVPLIDMAVRLVVFVLVHAIVYAVSAQWFGSFGGSPSTALAVVAPTLARSALFENLSGVYLYATLASAIPLYAAAIGRSRRLGPLARRLPGRSGPVLIAAGLFALFVLALTAAAAVVADIQGVR
jgi:hypothetical protein